MNDQKTKYRYTIPKKLLLLLLFCLILIVPALASAQTGTVVFSANFDAGADSFTFVPDIFSAPATPGYASGSHDPSGGNSGGGLYAVVGGINGDDILNMSGGWQRDFNLSESGNTIVTFYYNMTQTATYETDEYSELRLSIDGALVGQGGNDYLLRITGDGNAGSDLSSGWQQAQVDLGSLSTGNHSLAIGVFNNKKTYADESTSLYIDDVLVEQGDAPPPSGILVAGFDGGDAGSFSYVDDAFRQTANPAYAGGATTPDGGYSGGGLQVDLGGIDNNGVYGLSGGWRSPFFLQEATNLTVSFRYNLTQTADYESSEFSQALVTVDGLLYGSGGNTYAAQLSGGGSSGWQQFQATLGSIPAGNHAITIGGYNNGKDASSEATAIVIDDVLVDGTPSGGTQVIDSGMAATGYHGAVASGINATDVGVDILAQGGNAFDAAAATLLALTETDNTLVHFGGESPIILYDQASNEVKVMDGQGPAPAAGTYSYFSGIGGIPSGTNIKNAAVPGSFLATLTLLKDYGTMTFEEVAAPTVQLYNAHTGWKSDMADTLQDLIDADVNARNGGGTREDGIQAARDLFYSGALADEMDAWLQSNGGLIRKSDLVAFGSKWADYETPVSVNYRGFEVYKTDTWTQGPFVLESLNILEGYNLTAMGLNQPDYIHTSIEALKLGLADRDTYFGDPKFVSVPLAPMLSDSYADARRGLINPNQASQTIQPGDPASGQPLSFSAAQQAKELPYGPKTATNDTSTVVTADRWGNVVVATPSGWGGVLLGNTGIYYGNRLRSSNTFPPGNHPNVVAPGKRPRITLTPTLVVKDGKPVMGISVAGGDQQDQAVQQLITNYIDFGLAAEESANTPRFGTDHLTGSFSQPAPDLGSLILHSSTATAVRNDLSGRGHDVSTQSSAWGRPSVVVIHPDSGTFEAAGDSTANRRAATYTDLTVLPDNEPPVADSQSVAVDEDGVLPILVTGSDSDGDPITYNLVSGPANGILGGALPNVTYTPGPDFNGADNFTFVTNDGVTDSAVATVTITVNAVNDAPTASDVNVTTDEDTGVNITLLANDVDLDSLNYIVVTQPGNGTLSGSGANLTYTPAGGFSGSDSFTYKANDTLVDSNVATVTITVNDVNDPPVANPASVTTDEDSALAITLTGSDPDGGEPTYHVVTGPANGLLSGTEPFLTYTPNGNFNGQDSFTFKANDGVSDSAEATVSITVNAVNDVPSADGQSVSTDQDVDLPITLTGSDIDGDGLTFSVVSGPSNGSLSGTAPNLTYEPNAGYVGADSFTFVANDGTVNSPAETVSITVNAVNHAPTAKAQAVNTNEDTDAGITLTGTDPDPGDVLTYQVVTGPADGSLSGTAPDLTYSPDANFNGADSFTFKVNDGQVDSAAATVSITVNAVNDVPTADGQSVSTDQDVDLPITLTGSDIDGDGLTFSVVSGPSNGSLSGTAPNLTYEPNAGYVSADSFTFVANDGTVNSPAATVSITVNAVNHAPTANAQAVNTNEDTDAGITLTGTDPDPGDVLTYQVVTGPADGSLSGTAPDLTYSPDANFNGADSFTFKVNDGQVDSAAATVSITVNAVNDVPVADNQSVSTNEGTGVGITLSGSDIDGDALTFAVAAGPSNGSLSGAAPDLTYTPDPGFVGSDSFTYVANDGSVDSAAATVSITVNAVNDPPTANSQAVNTNEDTAVGITLTGSDPENDPLSFQVVSGPSDGSLSGTAPNLSYAPAANFNGSDSFTFKINDGEFDSNTATVSITVAAVNDAPTADDQSVATNAGEALAITLSGSDIDSGSLTYAIASQPSDGTLSGSAPNVLYTPDGGFDGSDSFTFVANDGQFDSNTATVSITVNPSGPVVVFADDFETNQGWVTDPNGSDSATTGMWEVANPQATSSSGPKQLNDTVSGVNALVTGALAGSSVGTYDIDKGVTSVRSPQFTLPEGLELTLDFHYYMAHRTNSSTADFFRVSVVGSSSTLVFEELGASNDDDAVWDHTMVNLNAFAGQTVYLLIEAADAAGGSIVEAAVDDLTIVAAPPATAVFEAGFDSGSEGFTYVDNPFASGDAAYADGTWLSSGGFSGGGLQVYVGGQNNDDIYDMNGGWRNSFNLASMQSTVLSFYYNMTAAADYESNEYSEVRVTIDDGSSSTDYIVANLTGDGNNGGNQSTGWQMAQIDLGSLSAGDYSFTIGVFNNQKTYNNEWSDVVIDDVVVAVR